MGQPNKFEFSINVGGIDEEIISQAPTNWLNTTIKFTRSKVYGGLFRGETDPIPFVTTAARILRKAYYTTGINAFVKTSLNLLNPATWLHYNIFKGVLDFSTVVDSITSFTVNAISDDFSVQLNANDSTTYAIPLDVPEAINLELTPLALRETSTIIPSGPPDGIIHSDYWPPIQIVNNQQNSVNYSTQAVSYQQLRSPDWSTVGNNFFFSRVNGNLLIKGSISGIIFSVAPTHHVKLYIINNSGTIRVPLVDKNPTISGTETFNITLNQSISVMAGERLFLYMEQVDTETINTGIAITGGSIDLSYETISPATMCKALPAFYVVKYLLQAMNTNQDSGPNQPVPFKSDLLSGSLSNLVITSSDSIKTALGSLFYQNQTLFPGSYKVLSGSALYGTTTFTSGQTFGYDPSLLFFTGDGVIEKIVSGFVGAVYNPGDTLQAGGTYLVGGNAGTFVTYNAINYNVGEFFQWILGFDTFAGSDDTSFVEQTGIAPQLLITFRDTYQSILGLQGGNCAFGIETIAGIDTCFIESLGYVYRGTVGNLNVGVVDKDIKIQPATDMIGNTLVVGYKDQQYSQLNGFAEVNSQQNYSTVLIVPKKEINLVSVFRADPYGIEEIRVAQNDTASSRSDNDTFMIWKKDLPENVGNPLPILGYYYHPLTIEGLMTNPITGLPMITGVDSSYYNWKISPKRNLIERGGPYLSSIYYGMKGYKITLSGAAKNTALVTTDINGLRVSEAEPISISSLPNPLFIPIYCTFKPGLPTNALQMMDNLPYGYITFTYNNKQFKMFADTISVDVGQNTEQEIKGLLTPNNDLTQFIH